MDGVCGPQWRHSPWGQRPWRCSLCVRGKGQHTAAPRPAPEWPCADSRPAALRCPRLRGAGSRASALTTLTVALSTAALTVFSCPRSVTSPQTPRTATPSPRPATCWTSCCARTSARPRGRPCPEAGPPPPPTPWAPAPWAVTCPEVGQVRRRRERPSPGGAGAFQAAGFLVHLEDSHMRHLGVLDASRAPGTQLHERHRPHVLRAFDPPMVQV